MNTVKLTMKVVLPLIFSFQTAYGQSVSDVVVQIERCNLKASELSTRLDKFEDKRRSANFLSGGGVGVGLTGVAMRIGGVANVNAFGITGPYVITAGLLSVIAGGVTHSYYPESESDRFQLAKLLYEMERDIALDILDGETSSISQEYVQSCFARGEAREVCENIVKAVRVNIEAGNLCAGDHLASIPEVLVEEQ